VEAGLLLGINLPKMASRLIFAGIPHSFKSPTAYVIRNVEPVRA